MEEQTEVEVVYMSRLPFPIHLHGGPGAVGRALAALDDMITEADLSANCKPAKQRSAENEDVPVLMLTGN